MLTGEMAKYQIQDRVREAEQGRLARSTEGRRLRDRAPQSRKAASGLLAAVATGLRRKTTPTTGPASVRLA